MSTSDKSLCEEHPRSQRETAGHGQKACTGCCVWGLFISIAAETIVCALVFVVRIRTPNIVAAFFFVLLEPQAERVVEMARGNPMLGFNVQTDHGKGKNARPVAPKYWVKKESTTYFGLVIPCTQPVTPTLALHDLRLWFFSLPAFIGQPK